jgi:hypothetical protein
LTRPLTERFARAALLTLALLLGAGSAPAGAQSLPPGLSVDQAFFPPTGIARDGGAGTGTDIPGGIAVDGDRIYTVGESNGEVAIVARRSNGAFESAFGGGDGRLDLALGTGKDVGQAILVLPDRRLRILAAMDADTSSSTNNDIAVVGLNPDGSYDETFGVHGRMSFPVGPIDDAPSRMIVDAAGRLAIAGWRKDANGKEDSFIAMVTAAGALDPTFDGDGIRTLDRAGGLLNDRAIDLAWRPGGGVVALLQVATNADTNVNNFITALHAFTASGADDATFSGGDVVLGVGDPNTIPGGLLSFGGRLWVTGSTKVGADTDAFLARVEADGSGLASRRFDMRGAQIPAEQVVVSGGGDLDVLPGASPTMVIVGSTTYNSRTYWSAAAFTGFEGDLAQALYGDVLIPTEEYGALLGVAAADGALAVTGSLLNVNGSFDTSFGTFRLLVDADKKCDLAIEVPQPLEAEFDGTRPLPATVRVTNAGTKACGGVITVPAGYELRVGGVGGPIPTGPLGPGETFSTTGAQLVYLGARRREDTIDVKVTATGDADATNNARRLHILFRYCDLQLRPVKPRGRVPSEGPGRFEFDVRNVGSTPCRRVRVSPSAGARAAASPDRYTLAPGRSVSDEVAVALVQQARAGTKVMLKFRAQATGDVDAANDTAGITARVVRVGDSDVRHAGARVISGRARGGSGPGTKAQLRLRAVDVAVRRLGGGCRWLASSSVKFRKGGGACKRPAVWLRATGTSSWRLALRGALPPGRYVAYSRARIGSGFREAIFTAKDRTKINFKVR